LAILIKCKEGFQKYESKFTILRSGKNLIKLFDYHGEWLFLLPSAVDMKKYIASTLLCISLLKTVFAQQTSVLDTDLPIVTIHTRGGKIVDASKITADFTVTYNGQGKRNKSTDVPNEYNGKAGIEYP
jgi:hypothetical protein